MVEDSFVTGIIVDAPVVSFVVVSVVNGWMEVEAVVKEALEDETAEAIEGGKVLGVPE